MGVKFGASKKAIMETAQSLGGVLDQADSKGDAIAFDRIIISGRPAVHTVFYTSRNKFRQGLAYFKPSSKTETSALFTQMVEEISDIYGHGELQKSFPSEEIKELELKAIEAGKGTVNCIWKSNTDNVISLEITDDLLVKLTYQDGSLHD